MNIERVHLGTVPTCALRWIFKYPTYIFGYILSWEFETHGDKYTPKRRAPFIARKSFGAFRDIPLERGTKLIM
jgi:hypothetical protein